MKTVDFGLYIVVYNFIIGVLVMISSEKLGIYAGYVMRFRRGQTARLTRIGMFTFGACVATVSLGVFVAGYILKL